MARIETGPAQAGEDWPGIFIRGDDALMAFAPALSKLIDGEAGAIEKSICGSLLRLLREAAVREGQEVQMIALAPAAGAPVG